MPLPPVPPRAPELDVFEADLPEHDGWAKYNRRYWRDHYEDFLDFFFTNCFTEPHSTKAHEDCVGWGLETTPETLADTAAAPGLQDEAEVAALGARVRCPVLVIHGDEDAIRPWATGARARRAARVVSSSRWRAPVTCPTCATRCG